MVVFALLERVLEIGDLVPKRREQRDVSVAVDGVDEFEHLGRFEPRLVGKARREEPVPTVRLEGIFEQELPDRPELEPVGPKVGGVVDRQIAGLKTRAGVGIVEDLMN